MENKFININEWQEIYEQLVTPVKLSCSSCSKTCKKEQTCVSNNRINWSSKNIPGVFSVHPMNYTPKTKNNSEYAIIRDDGTRVAKCYESKHAIAICIALNIIHFKNNPIKISSRGKNVLKQKATIKKTSNL